MRCFIIETESKIICSRDNIRSRDGTNNRTYMVESSDIEILWPAGNEIGTGKLTTVELVDHKTLERVGNWIDVIDPAKPGNHCSYWNDEASVDH